MHTVCRTCTLVLYPGSCHHSSQHHRSLGGVCFPNGSFRHCQVLMAASLTVILEAVFAVLLQRLHRWRAGWQLCHEPRIPVSLYNVAQGGAPQPRC